MNILRSILKFPRGTALIWVISFIGLVSLVGLVFNFNEEEVDSSKLVKSADFKNLHQLIASLDSIKNIAVLPNDNYIVINGTVINVAKRTYGQEPELGFYITYYEEGNKIAYTSLNSLFISHDIRIDSLKAFAIIKRMKNVGISDIVVLKERIIYRWKVSSMYGEEGIIYSNRIMQKDSTRFDLLENVGKGFYHFAVKK